MVKKDAEEIGLNQSQFIRMCIIEWVIENTPELIEDITQTPEFLEYIKHKLK